MQDILQRHSVESSGRCVMCAAAYWSGELCYFGTKVRTLRFNMLSPPSV